MKKLIDRLVERLYFKRFPDRVSDHEIATTPLPVIKEERDVYYRAPVRYTGLIRMIRREVDYFE